MHKSMTAFMAITAMLTGCVSTPDKSGRSLPVKPRVELIEYDSVYLQNEFIKLEMIPDAMGRIGQITFLPNKRDMLIPFIGRETAYDPLFSRHESNGMGLRDLFWGVRGLTSSLNPMNIVETNPDSITFYTDNYGFLNASMQRAVKLPENSTVLEICSTVIRRSSDTRHSSLQPWYNLVPAGSGTAELIIPARGGVSRIGSRICVELEQDCLFGGEERQHYYVAPARNWLATSFPDEKLVFAIYVPEELLQPEGFFYFWNGRTGGNDVKTTEIILSGKETKPGEPYNYSCRLGIFPGLESIKEICGDTAIDCRIKEKADGWIIELDLCPGRQLPAGSLTLELRPVAGKGNIVKLGKIELESLPTAKVKTLSFTVPREKSLSGRYRICGTLPSGQKFELLEPLLENK